MLCTCQVMLHYTMLCYVTHNVCYETQPMCYVTHTVMNCDISMDYLSCPHWANDSKQLASPHAGTYVLQGILVHFLQRT